MSHTPWRMVRNMLNKRIWSIMAGDTMIVAEATEDDDIARLIASAPDLLAALIAIADYSPNSHIQPALIARAALKLAKGG